MEPKRKTDVVEQLVRMLEEERGQRALDIVKETDPWLQFRALVNTRPPWPASDEFTALQDELLQGLIAEAGIHGLEDAEHAPVDGRLRLWRGDITTFASDAIVNAANSQRLGCWAPLHYCIDNAIHTFAGVQLRIECNRIMEAQGHEEPTGQAKITDAFNLPSKRVVHTVGPIAAGNPTEVHRRQLASCYESCLDAAAAEGLGSIAFCCISTGVFGFPQDQAAAIAVDTVRSWLDDRQSSMAVVFNVFGAVDERLYRSILGMKGGI
ncbi:MAG: protein-ADP-ribose hydrolase [Eggerthellaceae bacterium]|nr:protein-ADP-ribose hydrolase [Eggerthellaceae bacterium]